MKESSDGKDLDPSNLAFDPLSLVFSKLNLEDFMAMRATSRNLRTQADKFLSTLTGAEWLFYQMRSANIPSLVEAMSKKGIMENLRTHHDGLIGYLLNQQHKKEPVDAAIVLQGLAKLDRPKARCILDYIEANAQILLKPADAAEITQDDQLLAIFLRRSSLDANGLDTLRNYVQQSPLYGSLQSSFDAFYCAATGDAAHFEAAINAKPIIITLTRLPMIDPSHSLDLSYANLSEINLEQAELPSMNLQFSRLSSANLMSADMSRADLSNADLRGADCLKTNFWGTKLDAAICYGLNFDAETRFDHAVSNAKLNNLCYYRGFVRWNPVVQARNDLSNLLALLRLQSHVSIHGNDMFVLSTFMAVKQAIVTLAPKAGPLSQADFDFCQEFLKQRVGAPSSHPFFRENIVRKIANGIKYKMLVTKENRFENQFNKLVAEGKIIIAKKDEGLDQKNDQIIDLQFRSGKSGRSNR